MSPSDQNSALVQPEANRSIKPLSRPTTNHKIVENKNPVPTKNNMVSDSRPINKPEPNVITYNSATSRVTDTRPKTNQKTVESKNPASTRNINRVSGSRPINRPEPKVSNIITYNSATSKITDTAMKELKSSKIQVKRPEMIREGEKEKGANYISAHETESQGEKQEKKIQPVIQSYPGKVARLESSKSQQLRKTIRTAPKVQKAAVNGFKAYKGSAGQGNEKKSLKQS
jgi:hypothetical protein